LTSWHTLVIHILLLYGPIPRSLLSCRVAEESNRLKVSRDERYNIVIYFHSRRETPEGTSGTASQMVHPPTHPISLPSHGVNPRSHSARSVTPTHPHPLSFGSRAYAPSLVASCMGIRLVMGYTYIFSLSSVVGCEIPRKENSPIFRLVLCAPSLFPRVHPS